MSVDDIIAEIQKITGYTREQIMERIKRKQEELSNLVSIEGAAYLVAAEYGLDLFEKRKRRLQIKNIVPGLRNITFLGRVFRISPITEFKRRDGEDGKVVNLFIGDETGYVKLPLWNDQVRFVEEGKIRVGDCVQICNARSKQDDYGRIEISLGKYGSIHKVEVDLPSVEELEEKFMKRVYERRFIEDLSFGNYEIRGNIVHVFRGNMFYNVCPICKSTLPKEKDVCPEHGEVNPEHEVVLTTIVDDGTGNIRAVFFRDLVEKLTGLKKEELETMNEEERYKLIRKKILGKEFVLRGRVKKNKIFKRIEFIVSEVMPLNIIEESKKLAGILGV